MRPIYSLRFPLPLIGPVKDGANQGQRRKTRGPALEPASIEREVFVVQQIPRTETYPSVNKPLQLWLQPSRILKTIVPQYSVQRSVSCVDSRSSQTFVITPLEQAVCEFVRHRLGSVGAVFIGTI